MRYLDTGTRRDWGLTLGERERLAGMQPSTLVGDGVARTWDQMPWSAKEINASEALRQKVSHDQYSLMGFDAHWPHMGRRVCVCVMRIRSAR